MRFCSNIDSGEWKPNNVPWVYFRGSWTYPSLQTLCTQVLLLLNLSTKSPEGSILSHPSHSWHNFLSGEDTVLQTLPAAKTKEGFWRTTFKYSSPQLNTTTGLLGIPLTLWSASAIKKMQRHGHFSEKMLHFFKKEVFTEGLNSGWSS